MDKKRVIIETLPMLFLCILGGALAGSVLAGMERVLEMKGVIDVTGGFALPSIEETLLIYPMLLFFFSHIERGVGGNLGAIFGARVSSSLHTGG